MMAVIKKLRGTLRENRSRLDEIATVLIEKETLEGEDLEAIFKTGEKTLDVKSDQL